MHKAVMIVPLLFKGQCAVKGQETEPMFNRLTKIKRSSAYSVLPQTLDRITTNNKGQEKKMLSNVLPSISDG